MSSYSLKKGVVFIHIPKNAGTSIRANLKKAVPDTKDFDDIYVNWREKTGVKRDQAFANHFPYWFLQDLLHKADSSIPLEDMFSFMVVRNPFERLVSLYRHRLRKLDMTHEGKPRNTELDKKVALAGFKPWLLQTPHEGDSVLTRTCQLSWGIDRDGQLGVTKIVKIEDLEASYPDLLGPLGITVPPLGFANVGDGVSKAWRSQYDDETIAHVEQHFIADLEAFSYEF